jgi:multicomponent Na+:H+ antiporter subunit D
MIFIQDVNYTHTWILVLAGFTMMTGVLGALVQNELRRLLAFHSVSQMGYMVMGLGLFTVAGLAGSMLFFVHHALVKNALFLISGIVHRFKNTFDIRKLGGLQNALPGLSILFFICAMSSAGVPPFSGFFAKLALMKEGIQTQHYWITGVALVVGLCTLLVMGRVWAEVFWKKPPEPTKLSEVSEQDLLCLYLPVGMLTFFVVIVGFAAGPIYDYVEAAAKQVFYPQEYIQKVFGGMP